MFSTTTSTTTTTTTSTRERRGQVLGESYETDAAAAAEAAARDIRATAQHAGVSCSISQRRRNKKRGATKNEHGRIKKVDVENIFHSRMQKLWYLSANCVQIDIGNELSK